MCIATFEEEGAIVATCLSFHIVGSASSPCFQDKAGDVDFGEM